MLLSIPLRCRWQQQRLRVAASNVNDIKYFSIWCGQTCSIVRLAARSAVVSVINIVGIKLLSSWLYSVLAAAQFMSRKSPDLGEKLPLIPWFNSRRHRTCETHVGHFQCIKLVRPQRCSCDGGNSFEYELPPSAFLRRTWWHSDEFKHPRSSLCLPVTVSGVKRRN